LSGSSEVNPELSVVQRGEHRSKNKARVLDMTNIISGSPETEVQGSRVQDEVK